MIDEIQDVCYRLPIEKWREFAYFSANLEHILGLRFGKAHLRGYLQLTEYTTKQAFLDLRDGLPIATRSDTIKEAIHGKPAMFVSFHYGSYRTLPLRLLQEGRSVCVLLSQDVYDVYKEYYKNLLPLSGAPERAARLHLLRAEEPSVFFKLREMVAKGTHVFVYADGSNGTFSQPTKERLKRITLLNASISVRSGYLDFAYLLGLPVHLLLDRSEDPLKIGQLEAALFCYKLHSADNRREFVERALWEIYHQFGRILNNRPYLWEALLYLHRHYLPQSSVLDWDRRYRILPFSDEEQRGGLDRFTYRVHYLSR